MINELRSKMLENCKFSFLSSNLYAAYFFTFYEQHLIFRYINRTLKFNFANDVFLFSLCLHLHEQRSNFRSVAMNTTFTVVNTPTYASLRQQVLKTFNTLQGLQIQQITSVYICDRDWKQKVYYFLQRHMFFRFCYPEIYFHKSVCNQFK